VSDSTRSWEQFVRHRPELLRYVHSLISSPEDAADLLQEVGVVVLAHDDDAPSETRAFALWCRGIAHNLALHHWRAVRRYNHVFADWDDDRDGAEAATRAPSLSIEETLADRESLERCVADLDETSRELLRLRYVCGKSSREIARMLRQSPEAVRMKIMRVREALRHRAVEDVTPA